jgi:hypothetical protein
LFSVKEGVPKVSGSAWYEMDLADTGRLSLGLGSVRIYEWLMFFRPLAPTVCWIWWRHTFPTLSSTIFAHASLRVGVVVL